MDGRGKYMLGEKSVPPEAEVASAGIVRVAAVWHRRFFHLGFANLGRASKIVHGLPAGDVVPEQVAGAVCHPCAKAKMVTAPYT